MQDVDFCKVHILNPLHHLTFLLSLSILSHLDLPTDSYLCLSILSASTNNGKKINSFVSNLMIYDIYIYIYSSVKEDMARSVD